METVHFPTAHLSLSCEKQSSIEILLQIVTSCLSRDQCRVKFHEQWRLTVNTATLSYGKFINLVPLCETLLAHVQLKHMFSWKHHKQASPSGLSSTTSPDKKKSRKEAHNRMSGRVPSKDPDPQIQSSFSITYCSMGNSWATQSCFTRLIVPSSVSLSFQKQSWFQVKQAFCKLIHTVRWRGPVLWVEAPT